MLQMRQLRHRMLNHLLKGTQLWKDEARIQPQAVWLPDTDSSLLIIIELRVNLYGALNLDQALC